MLLQHISDKVLNMQVLLAMHALHTCVTHGAHSAAPGPTSSVSCTWRLGRAKLCGWVPSACDLSLQLRRRRLCRKPELVPLSAPAVAAAAAAGLLAAGPAGDDPDGGDRAPAAAAAADGADGGSDGGDDGDAAAANAPLPVHLVEEMLLERYSSKFDRLGVPQKMPGRRRWLRLQQARAAAAAEAAEDAAGGDADPAAMPPGGGVTHAAEVVDAAHAAVSSSDGATGTSRAGTRPNA